jgi:hypothetical protein
MYPFQPQPRYSVLLTRTYKCHVSFFSSFIFLFSLTAILRSLWAAERPLPGLKESLLDPPFTRALLDLAGDPSALPATRILLLQIFVQFVAEGDSFLLSEVVRSIRGFPAVFQKLARRGMDPRETGEYEALLCLRFLHHYARDEELIG